MVYEMVMSSLRGRLLISASLCSFIFLGLTGITLYQAYQQTLLHAQKAHLRAIINDLLRVADPQSSNNILSFPGEKIEHRLMAPGSGLYASVISEDNRLVWQSPSLIGQKLDFVKTIPAGQVEFKKIKENGVGLFVMRMGVIWEDNQDKERGYTFNIAQSTNLYEQQVREFLQDLWLGLTSMVIIFLLLQWAILHWGLSPLRRVAQELRKIESGEKDFLEGSYPHELAGLTKNLNVLINHERLRQKRYKNAMADLAHSFKTPLSVLRGCVEQQVDLNKIPALVKEQVDRLNQIVSYQLQRAATSGKATFSKPVPIMPMVKKIYSALDKVYADKRIDFQMDVSESSFFYGEEGDLFELLGNLLDNACKWCQKTVVLRAFMCKEVDVAGLALIISDDGPGIPALEISRILKRGERADSTKAGHGIGLAVVKEIVDAYNGKLTLGQSSIGGAKIGVFLQE